MVEGCVTEPVREEPDESFHPAKILTLVAKTPDARDFEIIPGENENRQVFRQYGPFVVLFEYKGEQNLMGIYTDSTGLANVMTMYGGRSPNPLVQVAVGLNCLSSDLEELLSAVTEMKLSVEERQMVYELGREQTSVKDALKDILSRLPLEEKQKFNEEKRNLSSGDLESLWNVYRVALDDNSEGPSSEE